MGCGWGPVAGSCGHGHEPSSSLTGEELVNELSDYHILKRNSVPWNYLSVINNVKLISGLPSRPPITVAVLDSRDRFKRLNLAHMMITNAR
jgi:hypothetical protein